MSSSVAYAIRPSLSLLSHWDNCPLAVGDYISVDAEKLDVQIQSGDYFVTLATKIELISQRLDDQYDDLADSLEQVAGELLYLQNYYKIDPKADV